MKIPIKTKVEVTKEIDVEFPLYRKCRDNWVLKIDKTLECYVVDEIYINTDGLPKVEYSKNHYNVIDWLFNDTHYQDSTQEEFEETKATACKIMENI